MKKKFFPLVLLLPLLYSSCKQAGSGPSEKTILALNLKRGPIISCGPPGNEYGAADFLTSCSEKSREDFNLAIKLLHSFEYDEAEKAFASVVDKDPGCAMAYWGITMSNFHPLWTPPTRAELEKGAGALRVAKSLRTTERESGYIEAIASFYENWETAKHLARCLDFEKGMEKLYKKYPEDKEAAIFYALALNAAADPADKQFQKQKKAAAILEALYPGQPAHPGIVHYLIHTYDYPELAQHGLAAARQYASIAPSSAHALHMPSHIFTRLGLWDECIQSNRASVFSARCYAEATGIRGHWDEEIHGLDYLLYAWLQKGGNDSARQQLDYLHRIREVYPLNFKVAYAMAAMPSRFVLENRNWAEAARLELPPLQIPWKEFPWQEAILHFTRLLGAVHTGEQGKAAEELKELHRLQEVLAQKDQYQANQVAIQAKAGEAWIRLEEGKPEEALALMKEAADMEDHTGKHPVTPGEVLPARELLGDMYLGLDKPAEALAAYETVLQKNPNRFNALYGAGLAAERSGNNQKAGNYYRQLLNQAGQAVPGREETRKCRQFLERHPGV